MPDCTRHLLAPVGRAPRPSASMVVGGLDIGATAGRRLERLAARPIEALPSASSKGPDQYYSVVQSSRASMSRPTRLTNHPSTPRAKYASDEPLSAYSANFCRELAEFLKRGRVISTGRALEVRCATSRRGPEWRRLGETTVEGIKLHEVTAASASTRYDLVYRGALDDRTLADQLYDTIIFADVFEHLADPHAVLERVRGLLREPRGQLMLSLPNVRHVSVLARLLIGGEWRYRPAGILDQTHLRFFNAKSARRLLAAHGYRVVAFDRWRGTALSRRADHLWPWVREFVLSQFSILAVTEASTHGDRALIGGAR